MSWPIFLAQGQVLQNLVVKGSLMELWLCHKGAQIDEGPCTKSGQDSKIDALHHMMRVHLAVGTARCALGQAQQPSTPF